MKPTGIVKDPIYLQHEMGSFHPENPQRLEVIYQMIEASRSDLNLIEIPARHATKEELSANHDPRYVEEIAATAGRSSTFLDPDTSACAYSWDAAAKAVGGLCNLIDAVMDGSARNGFALVRPPGHHAERNRAMGFCLFNNVALAARYAVNGHGMQRVAIVDWDLHHGNGTQNSFYGDPKVLFFSTHQSPHYPGTGRMKECGQGPGEGFTVNVPLGFGAGDPEYVMVFHTLVAPLLESYKPELILVSAGFDAHRNDPLGGMDVTEDGYEQMVQLLMHLANDLCSDRVILTLEGGYDLTALRDSSARIFRSLSTYDPEHESVPIEPSLDDLSPSFKSRLKDVLSVQQKYWPNLPQF